MYGQVITKIRNTEGQWVNVVDRKTKRRYAKLTPKQNLQKLDEDFNAFMEIERRYLSHKRENNVKEIYKMPDTSDYDDAIDDEETPHHYNRDTFNLEHKGDDVTRYKPTDPWRWRFGEYTGYGTQDRMVN